MMSPSFRVKGIAMPHAVVYVTPSHSLASGRATKLTGEPEVISDRRSKRTSVQGRPTMYFRMPSAVRSICWANSP